MSKPLKFTRVMAGEYFCDTERGRYEIDFTGYGCTDVSCDHWHEGWHLRLVRSLWGHEALGIYRTFTDAKIAATKHARS